LIDTLELTRDDKLRVELLSDFYTFVRVFYKLRTNKDWETSAPIGRESHYVSISNALTDVFYHRVTNLQIWCPPRYAKSEMCTNFIAWALARYPDCSFLYTSYSHDLAAYHTNNVRKIMLLPEYQELFNARISSATKAKDNFETVQGGIVLAAGVGGSIVGKGAGIKGVDRFGGCVIIDDSIKPTEAASDTVRASTNEWYLSTLQSRRNSPNTPFIFIGQRVHEDDLAANLALGFDSNKWETLDLPALDKVGNALNPKMHTKEKLLEMQKTMPYIFAAQMQQDPMPAGGALFKREYFPILDEEPEMLSTFITADTAETEKTYNDATVFSFWGLYYINNMGMETKQIGLHWIDCIEVRIEPKDLENEFLSFYLCCMRHPVPPTIAAIEKKSTGVTLVSVLQDKIRGIQIREIERSASAGSKADRFIAVQAPAAEKLISFTKDAKHVEMCIKHMMKITANNSHRFDDICDTFCDAVNLGLINKTIRFASKARDSQNKVLEQLAANYKQDLTARVNLYGNFKQ